jgi:hypothetical protein
MPRVHVTGGYLNVDTMGPEGPVDPGFGGGADPGHPWLPGHLPPIGGTLPEPPPGIWPPPVAIWPPTPLPPDYPMPPGAIWPPVGHPGNPLPPVPGHPDTGLPPDPAYPDAGLPPVPGHPGGGPITSQKMLVAIVAVTAHGLKCIGYTVVDPSLDAGMPLPPHPEPK